MHCQRQPLAGTLVSAYSEELGEAISTSGIHNAMYYYYYYQCLALLGEGDMGLIY